MRAIAVDRFGFGDTDMPDPATVEYTQRVRTRHMIAFIEALGVGPVDLIGNSMGETTAMGVVLERPDLVRNLVLMGSAVNMTPADMAANRANLAPVLAYNFTRAGMLALIKGLTFSYDPPPEMVDYRYTRSVRPQAKIANTATMAWVGQNGLCYTDEQIASIRTRTLIVAGKNDKMVPIHKMYELLDRMTHAWGYFLPDCGHWIMIEYPRQFTDITLRFFGKLA
jgi:pimeloyl-ACP methyl ester carboxylesterase